MKKIMLSIIPSTLLCCSFTTEMEEIEVDASYIDQYFFIHKK